MIPPIRRQRSGAKELDLRKEFDELVYGANNNMPHNHLALIREVAIDVSGKKIKCACSSKLTDEPDQENQCKYCLGEGFIWNERFTRCYSTLSGSVGGKADKIEDYRPGNLATDYKIFYLRYDEKISYNDKIVELSLDLEGNLIIPYKREKIYRPESIQKYRADNGRVEYIAVYCKEFNSIRERR